MNEQLLNEVVNSQTAGIPVVKADVLPKNIKPVETQPASQPAVPTPAPTPTPVVEGGEDKVVQSKPAQQTQSFQINEEIARPLYEQANKYARNIQGLQKDLDYDKFVSKYLSSPEAASSYYKGLLNISREVPLKVAIGGSQDFLKKLYITPEAEAAAVNNVVPQNNLATIKQQANKKIEEVNGKYGINEQAAKIANNQPLNPIEGFGYSVGLDPLATREQAIIEGGTEALHKGKSQQFQKENPVPELLQAPAEGGGVEGQLKQRDAETQKQLDDIGLKTWGDKLVNPLAEGDFGPTVSGLPSKPEFDFTDFSTKGLLDYGNKVEEYNAQIANALQWNDSDREKYGATPIIKLKTPEKVDSPIYDWESKVVKNGSFTDYWSSVPDNVTMMDVDNYQKGWGTVTKAPATLQKIVDDYYKVMLNTDKQRAYDIFKMRERVDQGGWNISKDKLAMDFLKEKPTWGDFLGAIKDNILTIGGDKGGVISKVAKYVGSGKMNESFSMEDFDMLTKMGASKDAPETQLNILREAFANQKQAVYGEYLQKKKEGIDYSEQTAKAFDAIDKQWALMVNDPSNQDKVLNQMMKEDVDYLDYLDKKADEDWQKKIEAKRRKENPLRASIQYDVVMPVKYGAEYGAISLMSDIVNLTGKLTNDFLAIPGAKEGTDFAIKKFEEELPERLTRSILPDEGGIDYGMLLFHTAKVTTEMVGTMGAARGFSFLGRGAKALGTPDAIAGRIPVIAATITQYGDDTFRSAKQAALDNGFSEEYSDMLATDYRNTALPMAALIESMVGFPFSKGIGNKMKADFSALLKTEKNPFSAIYKATTSNGIRVLKEIGEQSIEEVSAEASDRVSNLKLNKRTGKTLLDDDLSFSETLETVMIAGTSTVAVGLAKGELIKPTLTQQAAVWQAMSDPDKFNEQVSIWEKDGKIEKWQGTAMKTAIKDLKSAMTGLPAVNNLSDQQKLDLSLLIYEKKKLKEEVSSGYVDDLFREKKEAEIAKKIASLDGKIMEVYGMTEKRESFLAQKKKMEQEREEAKLQAEKELQEQKIEVLKNAGAELSEEDQKSGDATKEGKVRDVSAVNDVTGETGFKTGEELVPNTTVVADIPKKNAVVVTKVFEQKPVVNKPEFKDEASRQKFAEDNQGNIVTETVSVADIIPTQKKLDKTNTGGEGKPLLVRTNEGLFVLDGHHTIANQIKDGTKEVDADIIDLTNKIATDDTKDKTGLPSEVGVGQESVQAQPIEKTGAEATTTGGDVQASEKVTEVKAEAKVSLEQSSDENGRKSFNVKDEKGNTIGVVSDVRIVGDNNDKVSVYPDIKSGEGYGQATYLELSKLYPDKNIVSGDLSPQAEKMWNNLYEKGKATRKQVGTFDNGKPQYQYELNKPKATETTTQEAKAEPVTKQSKGNEKINKAKETVSNESTSKATRSTAVKTLFSTPQTKGKTTTFETWKNDAKGKKQLAEAKKALGMKASTAATPVELYNAAMAKGKTAQEFTDAADIAMGRKEAVKENKSTVRKALETIADAKYLGNNAYSFLVPGTKKAINLGIGTVKFIANSIIKAMDTFADIKGNIDYKRAGDAVVKEMKATDWYKNLKPDQKNAINTYIKSTDPFAAMVDITEMAAMDKKTSTEKIIKAEEKALETKIVTDLTKEITQEEKQAIKDKAKEKAFEAKIATDLTKEMTKDEKQAIKDKAKSDKEIARAKAKEEKQKLIDKNKANREKAKAEKERIRAERKKEKELLAQAAKYPRQSKSKVKLPKSKTSSLIGKATRATTEKGLSEFTSKYDDAVYEAEATEEQKKLDKEKMDKAKRNRTALAKKRKDKKFVSSSDKNVIRQFLMLPIATVKRLGGMDMVERYNQLAEALLGNVTPGGVRTVDNVTALEFVNNMNARIKEDSDRAFLENDAIKILQQILVSEGELSPNATIDEIKEKIEEFGIITAEERKVINEKFNKEKIIEEKKKLKQNIANLKDVANSGERWELYDVNGKPKMTKVAIDNIVEKLDPDNLDFTQLALANHLISNFILNNTANELGKIEAIAIAQDAVVQMTKAFEAAKVSNNKLKGLKTTISDNQRYVNTHLRTLPGLLDAMALDSDLAAKIQEILQISALSSAYTNMIDEIQKDWNKQVRKIKLSNAIKFKGVITNPKNRLRQGIYSTLLQTKGNTDKEQQESFEDNKRLILEDIAAKRKSAKKSLIREADMEEKIFNELFANVSSIAQAKRAMNKYAGDKKMVELAQSVYEKNLDKLQESSILYSGKELDLWNNYTHRKWKKKDNNYGSYEKDLFTNTDLNKNYLNQNVNKKTSGVIETRGSDVRPNDNRVLNLDFYQVQDNAINESYYQANTLGTRMAMKEIFNRPEMRDMLGEENFNLIRNRAIQMVNHHLGITSAEAENAVSLGKVYNYLLRTNTARALGGFAAFAQQLVPAVAGAMVRLIHSPIISAKIVKNMFRKNNKNLYAHSNFLGRKRSLFEGNLEKIGSVTNSGVKGSLLGNYGFNLVGVPLAKLANGIDRMTSTGVELVMTPLQHGDYVAAKGAWMAYYEKKWKSMPENKGKKFSWKEQEQNPSKSVSAYADQMVESSMNVNDQAKAGAFFRSQDPTSKLIRTVYTPFSSFAVGQDLRFITAIRKATSFNTAFKRGKPGVKAMAQGWLDIGAILSEQITFQYVKAAAAATTSLLAAKFLFGSDDEEEKAEEELKIIFSPFSEEGKKVRNKIALNAAIDNLPLNAVPLNWAGPLIGNQIEDLGKVYLNSMHNESEASKAIFGDQKIFSTKGLTKFPDKNFEVTDGVKASFGLFGMAGNEALNMYTEVIAPLIVLNAGYETKSGKRVDLNPNQKTGLKLLIGTNLLRYSTGLGAKDWDNMVKLQKYEIQDQLKKGKSNKKGGGGSSDNLGLGNMGLDMNLDLDLGL
jgi:hypothetical protein